MDHIDVLLAVQRWSAFVFDLPLGYPFPANVQVARETGIGISAPNAHRLRDVIRHDLAMVVGLVSLLALISRALYLFILPDNIFDIRYVLAVLYMIYSIGTVVLIYQFVRDSGHPTGLDMELPELFSPFEHCPICLTDAPKEELITLECYGDEEDHPERRLHSFHPGCLLQSYTEQRALGREQPTCPICRQVPFGYRRLHGPPEHGILDNSRLMWYINSLFTRRVPITVSTFRTRFPSLVQYHPEATFDRIYLQVLTKVLPLHMLFMTQLLIFLRFIYLTLLVPFSWPVWTVVVGVALTLMLAIPAKALDQHYEIVQMPRALTFGHVIDDIANACNYIFPGTTGANPETINFTLREFIQRQLSILFNYSWMFVWHMVCKVLFYILTGIAIALITLVLYYFVLALFSPL